VEENVDHMFVQCTYVASVSQVVNWQENARQCTYGQLLFMIAIVFV